MVHSMDSTTGVVVSEGNIGFVVVEGEGAGMGVSNNSIVVHCSFTEGSWWTGE